MALLIRRAAAAAVAQASGSRLSCTRVFASVAGPASNAYNAATASALSETAPWMLSKSSSRWSSGWYRGAVPAASGAAAQAAERAICAGPRTDWSREEIGAVYNSPLLELMFHASQVHKHAQKFGEVQLCTLLSIKTGGCAEDCAFCPQSSKYKTEVKATRMLDKDAVLEAARKAKEGGSSRFCMGAAWRDTVGRKTNFNQVLEFVKEIKGMGLEVCCTLGMLQEGQAEQLKEAGLTSYNHNMDSSREFYPTVISTRSYDERIQTLEYVRNAGLKICSGGILGLGESAEDRVSMLHTLATLSRHPDSVPINALVAAKGTPLQDQKPVEIWEMVRMIATARIVMPESLVRLSAGRVRFSHAEQALCFMAGANSIFTGSKLFTTKNSDLEADHHMFHLLGLTPMEPSPTLGSHHSSTESDDEDAVAAL